MNRKKWPLFLAVLTLAGAMASPQQPSPPVRDEPKRLPDGRNQTEAILKADYEKNLDEAGKLLRLAEDLKMELEKNEQHVVSVGMLKKTEEIEKLAKRIRNRLTRN